MSFSAVESLSATSEVSSDVVAVVYTGTGRRDDGEDFTGIMTSTYRRDGSEWKLALHQQTPTAEPEGGGS